MKCDHIECRRNAEIFIKSAQVRYCKECLKSVNSILKNGYKVKEDLCSCLSGG